MGFAEVAQWFLIALSLAVATKVLLQPIVREKTLNRAFKSLEHEVAEQWEKVESHLGRISRLKRDIAKHSKSKGAFETEQPGNEATSAPPTTRAQIMKEHKARSNHA